MALVDLVAPDGSTSAVEESDVQAAIAAGFRAPLPTEMVAPDGGVSDVGEHAAEAEAAGFRRPFAPAIPEPVNPNETGLAKIQTAAESLLGLGFVEPAAQIEGRLNAGFSKLAGMVEGLPMELDMSWDEGVQQARKDIQARKDANPWLAGLTGAGGQIAVTAATGGAGAAIPAIEAGSAEILKYAASKMGVEAAKIATGTLGQRIVLQTAKAIVPNVVEGAVIGAATGVDQGLQAAYAVDGELNAGDYLSVAEAGLGGLALGAGVGAIATGAMTAVGETIRSGARVVGSIFSRGASTADDAAKALPSGEPAPLALPEAEIEAVGMKRLTDAMPEAPAQPVGEYAAAQHELALTRGTPENPFFKGYEPNKPQPDAEKMLLDQGPLIAQDIGAEARTRAQRLADTISQSANADDILDKAITSSTEDITELAQIANRSQVLHGIAAKRPFYQKLFDAPTLPESPSTAIVLSGRPGAGISTKLVDGSVGTPSASYAVDDRTVALFKSIVQRVKDTIGDGTTYEMQELGGLGKGIKMAKAIQQKATEYEQAMAQGKAGTGYMILDDLKRIFGDFSEAKNQKIRTLVTGLTGDEGLYGELQRHLMDEDIFGAMAQHQAPVNSTWNLNITASKDASIRGLYQTAGEASANKFANGTRANGGGVRSWLSNTLTPGEEGNQAAVVRHLRALANDVKVRHNTWGNDAAKADAARAQVLVARLEANRDMVAMSQRAKKAVGATNEALGDTPVVLGTDLGGIGKGVIKIAQRIAKTAGRRPTAAESVAHVAVNTNASIARQAQQAASVATGTSKAARLATIATMQLSRAATIATIQEYARNTEPDSPDQRLRLNDATMLAAEAPELVKPLQDLQRAKDAFIREKLGPVLASGKVDAITQSKIIRYIDASEHPEQALERISQGEARPEDVETLWKLYPSQISKLRDQTLAAIKASGKQPTREAQARLQFAFRMHDTAYLQWLQASTAPVKEETPAPVSASVSFAMPDTAGKADSLMR